MPELPFLEVLAENLAAGVSGRRIETIEVRQPALLMSPVLPETFAGEFLSLPARKGKYIVLECESRRALVIHLMRLGRLRLSPPPTSPARGRSTARTPGGRKAAHSARIAFDDGSALLLIEHGTEKRARLWLAEDAESLDVLAAVGPDPSRGELSEEAFRSALGAESRRVKTFLTDQRTLAGIGNGLSDEMLYEARLSPMKLTGQVNDVEAHRLYRAMLDVLERQTELLRKSAAGELPQREPVEHYTVHDHAGERCSRCGGTIARISYADHETFYCPGCQTGGVPLKDRRLSKLLK